MAELNLEHKINIPFAQDGDRDEIPDTSDGGLVNNTDGLGVKYETPIGEGGEYYDREIFNGVLYKVYAAVKELQIIAATAGFPIDMTKALNVLGVPNGGTGGNTAAQARSNLGLGSLAVKSYVDNDDILPKTLSGDRLLDGAIKSEQIYNGAVTVNKLYNNSVNSDKITNNAVTNTKINDGAVTTSKIQNGAVTQEKLAANVVGNLPIGFIYFQLRFQKTPDELFGTSGKWRDVSSAYSGKFFRAAGGAAAAYGQEQGGGMPNISGNITTDDIKAWETASYAGALSTTNTTGYTHKGGQTWPTNISKNIYFNASLSSSLYGAAAQEVRPINDTIRIWQKVA